MRFLDFKRILAPAIAVTLFAVLMPAFPKVAAGEAFTRVWEAVGYVVQIGLAFALAWLTNRLIDLLVWQVIEARTNTPLPRLLRDMAAILIFLIAATAVAKMVFDQQVTAIWATSGVVAVVLGMAMRSVISDLFCGIALNVDQPFKLGEWVEIHPRSVDTMKGCVTEISWRSTRIKTTSNTLIIVPNSLISTSVLVNLSRPEPLSRFEIVLCFDIGVPTERALRILLAGVKSAPNIQEEPKPKVLVNQITQFGVEYKIRYWLEPTELSPRKGRHRVASSILEHLYQAGITPAYSKQDLFLSKMPNRQLDLSADRNTILSRVEIFSELEEEEVAQLSDSLFERKFEAGEILVKQGEPGDSMYILLEGLLGVYNESTEAENPIRIDQIEPGQFFGEMSLLTGQKRLATILAATEVIVFEISKDVFCPLLEQRPEIAVHLAKVIAVRRKSFQDKTNQISNQAKRDEETGAEDLLEQIKDFFSGLRGKFTGSERRKKRREREADQKANAAPSTRGSLDE